MLFFVGVLCTKKSCEVVIIIVVYRFASKAARFCDACGTQQVLIVKVALGNTHTQTTVRAREREIDRL